MPDSTLPVRVVLRSDHRVTLPDSYCKDLELKDGSVLELQKYGKDKILLTVLVR